MENSESQIQESFGLFLFSRIVEADIRSAHSEEVSARRPKTLGQFANMYYRFVDRLEQQRDAATEWDDVTPSDCADAQKVGFGCPDEELLEAYLMNCLPTSIWFEAVEAIKDHLLSCRDCRVRAAMHQLLKVALQTNQSCT